MNCKMRVSPKITTAALLGVLLASAAGFANPKPAPDTTWIRTEEELLEALFDSQYLTESAIEQLGALWDEHVPLLTRAYRSSRSATRSRAAQALSGIGTEEALAPLREALRDTTADFSDIQDAAVALACAGDAASIPDARRVLGRLEREIARTDRDSRREMVRLHFKRGVLLEAIARMERPDRNRPLMERGQYSLVYRFLLDDIASITLRPDYPFGAPDEFRLTLRPWEHEFDRDEFRDICTMLQLGSFVEWTGLGAEQYLVVELIDGRKTVLNWRGDTFEAFDPNWVWWVWPHAPLAVSAPRLAEYLRGYLPGQDEASSGESSN
jgi:hypothetical protein